MIIDVVPIKRLPRGIGDTFSYNLDPALESEIAVGQIVEIDFRNKVITGLVKTLKEGAHEPALKTVTKIINPLALITPEQMRLATWIAHYYFTSLGTAIKLISPDIPKRFASTVMPPPRISSKTVAPTPRLIWTHHQGKKSEEIKTLIQKTRKDQRQILWLFPEQYLARQQALQIDDALLWQHFTSKNKSITQWLSVLNGETDLIIGTRSALFAPFNNLGLVIVEDEAHPLYKSEITPRYHSRAIARQVALQHQAQLIFTSTAPSLETYREFNPEPTTAERALTIIDIKDERLRENYSPLSEKLQDATAEALAEKKKVFIYHNRRGHSTSATCTDCGYTFLCPDCQLPFTYHNTGRLVCHHCRKKAELSPFCPSCSSPEIKLMGKGAQKLAERITQDYPDARVARLDSDSTETELAAVLKADIIVGTEYAFSAERVPWNDIAVLGVINTDQALYRPDYRASERMFQNLSRLLYFRAPASATIILQTYNPDSEPIKALKKNPADFYAHELSIRKALKYPPYADVIKLIYRNSDEKKTVGEAMHIYHRLIKHLIKEAPTPYPVDILKPFPVFDRMERGKFRFHLIVRILPDAGEVVYEKIRQLVPPDWVFDRDPETLL